MTTYCITTCDTVQLCAAKVLHEQKHNGWTSASMCLWLSCCWLYSITEVLKRTTSLHMKSLLLYECFIDTLQSCIKFFMSILYSLKILILRQFHIAQEGESQICWAHTCSGRKSPWFLLSFLNLHLFLSKKKDGPQLNEWVLCKVMYLHVSEMGTRAEVESVAVL